MAIKSYHKVVVIRRFKLVATRPDKPPLTGFFRLKAKKPFIRMSGMLQMPQQIQENHPVKEGETLSLVIASRDSNSGDRLPIS